MTPALRESRQAVRRAGRATTFLVVVSAVLMALLIAMFAYLSERQQTLQDSIREDALWAVYQLDREARTLAQGVDQALASWPLDATEAGELGLRYDILYSRLTILDNAKYETSLAGSDGFLAGRSAIRDRILSLEPAFNRLAADGTLDWPSLAAAGVTLGSLVPVTERMLTETNTSVAAVRADSRIEVMAIQRATAVLVLVIGVAITLLILNLSRQLQLTRRTTDNLESAARDMSEAYRAAEAGNRAKSEFMAVMGHEIRTPLNAILGMAELLAEANLPEEDRYGVTVIRNSGQSLLETINEILDFAKLEHGDDLPAEAVAFSAGELVRKAIGVVEGRAREQDNDLQVQLADALDLHSYIGDPTRISRVLINLLSNAVKFTRGGTVTVTASQVETASAQRLRFEVADTGIGIADESLPRLFNAFSQVDSTISRRFGGTGLGLAICRRLVEALGGEIGVQSREGVGSTFWFEVPVTVSSARLPQPEADQQTSAVPRLKLLLVEDNLVNRQVVLRFLDRLGQSVDVATDGAQAVRMATGNQYDLILMDMQMPVMDGIAATRAIRALGGDNGAVPIVAMTANASDGDRDLCHKAGMDGFEVKPISSDRLASMLAGFGLRRNRHDMATSEAADGSSAPTQDATRDEQRVNELLDALGEDGFRDLLDIFFADAATLLSDLHRSLASHDLELFDRTLHSLKGAASNLGYFGFAAMVEGLRAERLDPSVATRIGSEIAHLGIKLKTAA
ncbi:MAG: response regulator [Rhizobiaceae bacterium]|nr:response regulator [Rhizobiaceae bacterium]